MKGCVRDAVGVSVALLMPLCMHVSICQRAPCTSWSPRWCFSSVFDSDLLCRCADFNRDDAEQDQRACVRRSRQRGRAQTPQHVVETATKTIIAEQAPALEAPADSSAQASGWSAAASVGAALGVMGVASLSRARTGTRVEAAPDMSSRSVAIPVGKAGFVGATNDVITVMTRCPNTGRAREHQVRQGGQVVDLQPLHAVSVGLGAV